MNKYILEKFNIVINESDKSTLLFMSLEKLQIQTLGKFQFEYADIDYSPDEEFKPGVYLETKAFLGDVDNSDLLKIPNHLDNMKIYEIMENGEDFQK